MIGSHTLSEFMREAIEQRVNRVLGKNDARLTDRSDADEPLDIAA